MVDARSRQLSRWDCANCGLPLFTDDDSCPDCGSTAKMVADCEED